MRDVYAAMLKAMERGESVTRVSVMKSSGSTPRSAGAVMAVFEDGSTIGTIGGGSVENASHIAAKDMQPGTSAIRKYDLTNNDAASLGMVCGGDMTVLLDYMIQDETNVALLKHILAGCESTKKYSLGITLGKNGDILSREVLPPDHVSLTVEADNHLLIEPLGNSDTVHFVGAGHVALATAKLAAFTDFQVHVVDDREDFANAQRFPDATNIHVAENLNDCLPASLNSEDYVVIMTRGHLHDRDVLAQALKTDAGYIGMIGSKKKKTAVYESLLNDGFTQTELKRVHCPIGLSIGAETPEEIAVSIMGELIAARAKLD